MPASFSELSIYRSIQANKKNLFFILLCTLVFLVGLYFRTSGLFRGLIQNGFIFHPDEPKQVLALFNFLNGDYIRYYGSLFYDGYPYGLNHLDEYLLRPLLFFFQPDIPEHLSLYYYARLLRLLYSIIIMFLAYQLAYRLIGSRTYSLLALFFISIAPLPITVSHFATGDIGVDLFCAFCLLFLYFYSVKENKLFWLFFCGATIGGAFSAKYNGLLIAIVPCLFLLIDYLHRKQLQLLFIHCIFFAAGSLAGLLLFTPNLILDFHTTLINIAANFDFIKNYNVPEEVLALSSYEKALLGLKRNTFYIISSLGYITFFLCLAFIFISFTSFFSYRLSLQTTEPKNRYLLLSIALFPLLSLFISLSGKYVVQPFHFSYLQLPAILVSCFVISQLIASTKLLAKGFGLLLILIITVEYFHVSWNENFFWRHEDNGTHAEKLPPTLYDSEAFFTHRSDSIRSLYLEPSGTSVFRNLRLEAKGPDAFFWKNIEVAPLPQVENPIGENYIFINGPTFPRNERMVKIHGKKIRRYLVLPAGKRITGFGLQSGAKPTEVLIEFGGREIRAKLEPNEQKILDAMPGTWKRSGEEDNAVDIIPLTITVPYNTVWLTILVNKKEKEIYNLYGGGQERKITPPAPVVTNQKIEYFDALSRIKFLEHRLSWRVSPGKRIPMWEVEIPAGRYILTAEIDGLTDFSEITIDVEGGDSTVLQGQRQSYIIENSLQRIEYSLTKTFAPFQTKIIVSGISGRCQVLFFKLTPDYQQLDNDFDKWHQKDIQPEWASRFPR